MVPEGPNHPNALIDSCICFLADDFKDCTSFKQVEDELRLNKVNRLQEEIQLELNNKYLNSVYKILIDGKTKDRFYGRTLGDKLVYIKDINASDLGSIIETEINEVSPYSLSGSKI